MADVIQVLNMLGLTPYLVGLVIAFGAIAVYFAFIHKA
jgi:hypothetical protein